MKVNLLQIFNSSTVMIFKLKLGLLWKCKCGGNHPFEFTITLGGWPVNHLNEREKMFYKQPLKQV